ncbi:MAG: lysophospholipid acyltransferase family protein [archaeon]
MPTTDWFSMRVFYPLFGKLFNFGHKGIEGAPPGENFIFVMNHAGALDVFFAPAAIVPFRKRPLRILLDVKVYQVPVLNCLFRGWNPIVFDVGDPESRTRSVREAVAALGAGDDVLIFPEGSVNADGRWKLRLHTGAVKIALLARKRILPARIKGSYDAWKFVLYRRLEMSDFPSKRNNAKYAREFANGMHNPFAFNFRTPVRISFGKPVSLEKNYGKFDLRKKSRRTKGFLVAEINELMKGIGRIRL